MSGTLFEAKREALQQERDILLEQYREVSAALSVSDPLNRPLLKASQRRIESDLKKNEAEFDKLLDELGAEGRGGRAPGGPAAVAAEVPFPYLLDRSDQEERLIDAVVAHNSTKRQRPFICVIHGDELECHTSYLKRLKIRSLPQILSKWDLKAKKIPIEEFEIQLRPERMTATDYEQALWGGLRAATHGSKPVTREEIVKAIAAHKVAVMLEVTLLTEDLRRLPEGTLDLFFEFWNRWPDLSGRVLLFVALCFKYQREPGSGWLAKAWSRARVNGRTRRYLDELDFGRFENIHGLLLPELRAVTRSDAEAMTRHKEISVYYGLGEEATRSLEEEIRSLYDEPTICTRDGCIPMETLLGRLSQIYREKQRQGVLRV